MSWDVIANMIALFAALVAIYAIWTSRRDTRFSMGVDLVMRLEEKFHSLDMKESRQSFANALINSQSIPNIPEKAMEVPYFFETIGLLVRRKAIDIELVHSAFYSWIPAYWLFLKGPVVEWRKSDSLGHLIYHDWEELSDSLVRYQAKQMSWKPDRITELLLTEGEHFLKGEMALLGAIETD